MTPRHFAFHFSHEIACMHNHITVLTNFLPFLLSGEKIGLYGNDNAQYKLLDPFLGKQLRCRYFTNLLVSMPPNPTTLLDAHRLLICTSLYSLISEKNQFAPKPQFLRKKSQKYHQ